MPRPGGFGGCLRGRVRVALIGHGRRSVSAWSTAISWPGSAASGCGVSLGANLGINRVGQVVLPLVLTGAFALRCEPGAN